MERDRRRLERDADSRAESAAPVTSPAPEAILAMQRGAGNQAVAGMLAGAGGRAGRTLARQAKPTPALSPTELMDFMHSQRGFQSSSPGAPEWDPNLVGKPSGTGYQTHGAIQILDAKGSQVAVSTGAYLGGGEAAKHAEHMAIDKLRGTLKGADVAGGRMVVAVEQVPCPGCAARLRAFAEELKLNGYEVHVPERASMTDPSKMAKPKTAAKSVFQGKRPPTAPKLIESVTLVKPGPRPPTGGAPPKASPVAAALAKDINTKMAGDLKLLRAASALKGGLLLLKAVSSLLQLQGFTSMATSKLSGKGFILTKEIAAADAAADDATKLQREYGPFSEEVQSQGFRLFLSPVHPGTLRDVLIGLVLVRSDLIDLRDGVRGRVRDLRKALAEVTAKRQAAEAILEDPKASAAIAMATMGTAELAQIFAAWEDLGHLEGRLGTAVAALDAVDRAVTADEDFMAAWWQYLHPIWDAAEKQLLAAAPPQP